MTKEDKPSPNFETLILLLTANYNIFGYTLGFVFGAVGIGFIADISSVSIAIQFVVWIALASGIFVLIVMRETKRISSMTLKI